MIEPLSDQQVQAIIKNLDDRRPHYVSEVDRLIKQIESSGLTPEDVLRLAKRKQPKEEEDAD